MTCDETLSTLIVDAAPLVAAADRRFADRGRVQPLLSDAQRRLVLPAPVSAEADYLLATKVGRAAQRAFLADLSIIVAAERHHTRQLLTFDQRHFRTVVPPTGGTFTLLPADDER